MGQLPRVSSRYGAPMGRPDRAGDPEAPHKFRLRRVRLDRGGYDDGGAYWGLGAPLYRYWTSDGAVEGFFRLCRDRRREVAAMIDTPRHFGTVSRVIDRRTAKAMVRDDWPNAEFYA